MDMLILIDTTAISSYANKYDSLSKLEQKLSNLGYSVNKFNYAHIQRGSKDFYKLLKDNYEKSYSAIFYAYADEVLLNIEIFKQMTEYFINNSYDYLYSEGYPSGITGQFFKTTMLDDLIELSNDKRLDRNFVYQTIFSKINDFDVDVWLSPIDLRYLRLNLNYENKNNTLATNKLESLKLTTSQEIIDALLNDNNLSVATPNYYQIQIVDGYNYNSIYLPAINFNNTVMNLEDFKTILKKIIDFSGEPTISLSYLGESWLHPNFKDFLQEILSFPSVKLHLETNGQIINQEIFKILQQFESDRLSLIIYADTIDETIYKTISNASFSNMMDFCKQAIDCLPESSYIQASHLKENDGVMESFYRYFKEKTSNVIINHVSSFGDFLNLEPIALIEPLRRRVCMATKRELAIRINGDIYSCRNDFLGNNFLGNIFNKDLDEIWQNMASFRELHVKESYPKHCKNCKEYAVFNF